MGSNGSESKAEQAWKQLCGVNNQRKKQVEKLLHASSSGISRSSTSCTSKSDSQLASTLIKSSLPAPAKDPIKADCISTKPASASDQQHALVPATPGPNSLSIERSIQALQSPESSIRRSTLKQLKVLASLEPPTTCADHKRSSDPCLCSRQALSTRTAHTWTGRSALKP